MATTQLRPMAMGEILDASFVLLRRHAGVVFGVAIVCQGVPTALSLFVEFNGGARQHFGLYAFWGYFLLFEALNGGRTPGKRLMGIRVVMDTGHPLTFTAAAVRNLVRIVDMQPLFTYQVGLAFVLFHAQNKRLGDIVAGTVVVRDRPENLQLATAPAGST